MKTYSTIVLIALIALMSIAGCAPAAQPPETKSAPAQPVQAPTEAIKPESTQALANPPDPGEDPNAQVILNMVKRLNAGDVDGSLAYFADDAVSYFIGMPPTGMEYYRGAEALRPTWEYCVSDHFQWELEITGVDGDLVYASAKTWLDFTRQLGVAPNEFDEVYQVKDGKITAYGSFMTEEALARFKPAFYDVMPPEPTPVSASGEAVSEMTVTFKDGACTTDIPAALQAGEVSVKVNVEDQDRTLYALTLFTLDQGKDMLDLMASTFGSPPDWAEFLLFEKFGPGTNETYSFTLEGGPVYLICWSQPPALPIGNAGPIQVRPAQEAAPAPERGEADIMLTYTDQGCSYEGPDALPPGDTTVIMNMQIEDRYRTANALMFFTLEPGYDLDDLVDSIWMPAPPEWSRMIFMHEARPGEVTYHDLGIEEGPLYYICLSGEAEDTAKVAGKGGPLEVSP